MWNPEFKFPFKREKLVERERGFWVDNTFKVDMRELRKSLEKYGQCLVSFRPEQEGAEVRYKYFKRFEKKLVAPIWSFRHHQVNTRLLKDLASSLSWTSEDLESVWSTAEFLAQKGPVDRMMEERWGSETIMARVTSEQKPASFGYYYANSHFPKPDYLDPRANKLLFNNHYADLVIGGIIFRFTPFNIQSKDDVADYLSPGEKPHQARYIPMEMGWSYATCANCYGDSDFLTFANCSKLFNLVINGQPIQVWVEKPSGLPGRRVRVPQTGRVNYMKIFEPI